MSFSLNVLGLVVIGVLGASSVCGQSVFDMPRLFPQHRRFLGQFVESARKGDLFGAESAARAAAKVFPRDANWSYNVACVCARDGRKQEALDWLAKAVELGFSPAKQLEQDGDLQSVRDEPKFKEILSRAHALAAEGVRNPTLSRALVRPLPAGTELVVDATDTQWEWDPARGGYMTTLVQPQPAATRPAAEAYTGPEAALVRSLWQGDGCEGVLYVSRDEDACGVRTGAFPGLSPVFYGDEAQRSGAQKGVANGLFSTGLSAVPAVGNASVMMGNSAFWRSIPRGISSFPETAELAYRLAAANQLYIYDATPDYTAALQGDLLIGQNPAVLLSGDLSAAGEKPNPTRAQRDLTELILAGLSVMPPETKREMFRKGAFVATMQRLLRESVRGAEAPEAYFTPAAHPVVFDPKAIRAEAFLRAANALRADALPPGIGLVVRQESMPVQGVDYFDAVGSEKIADTPLAIARVVRGRGKTRRLTVEAMGAGKGLTFRWFVANGDAQKVRIRPLTASGSVVTLEVDYPGIETRAGMRSRRVDVACVAVRSDGVKSAPAFVSFRYLGNERRRYDAQGRIQEIDYRVPESGYAYEDPALTAFKNWADAYHYDEQGRCTGWTRTHADGTLKQRFDARGRLVRTPAEGERPAEVQEISYVPRLNQGSDGLQAPLVELIQVEVKHGAGKP